MVLYGIEEMDCQNYMVLGRGLCKLDYSVVLWVLGLWCLNLFACNGFSLLPVVSFLLFVELLELHLSWDIGYRFHGYWS